MRSILIRSTLCLILVACAPQPPVANDGRVAGDPGRTDVAMDNAIHFTSPNGRDIVVPPGRYAVQSAEDGQLRFVPKDGGQSVTVRATTQAYEGNEPSPVAIAVPSEEGTLHVVLVLPGGTAWDAVGSASGVMPRGFPVSPIPPGRLSQALQAKVTPMPGSPSGNINVAKVRVPINVTIQPGVQVTGFQDCGAALAGGYTDSVVSQQTNFSEPYRGTANMPAENLGQTTTTPPGTPYIRMTAGARQQYKCAVGTVTVTPTTGSLGAGDHVQLKVTDYVYTTNGPFVQDRYQLSPTHNGPVVFPEVIMAGVYVGDNPSYVQQHEQEAAKNMSTGAMVRIEALVNGASMAKLPCRYTASPNGYGAGTVACSPSFPFPPQP